MFRPLIAALVALPFLSAPFRGAAAEALPRDLALEAIRASADLGGAEYPPLLLKLAASKDSTVRLTALEALATRHEWAGLMLDEIASGKLSSAGFPASVRRQLATGDPGIKERATKVLGAWNETNADLKNLITAKRKACLEGEPDLAQGKVLFQTTCMVCHSFYGGGQKVGPDLIGSGRSNLDAILANVIDPNQIIGNGYENIIVNTKDGRVVSGRLTEDAPSHVKLLAIGGVEQVVSRDQIEKLVNTHQSVMPVGFGALPDDAFRNLIWYVLAPPDEGPLSKEKKKFLSQPVDASAGPSKKKKVDWHAPDWESVSLWNPRWQVNAPEFDRTPLKLSEFHGRRNVLLMHPFDAKKPSTLERTITLEPGKPHHLGFYAASHDQGDWELRVVANGKTLKTQTIDHEGDRWKHIVVDLSAYAGKEVTLRLEGGSRGGGGGWEFEYWSDLELE